MADPLRTAARKAHLQANNSCVLMWVSRRKLKTARMWNCFDAIHSSTLPRLSRGLSNRNMSEALSP
eukprot:6148788-Amphidinium_carterae.2